MGIPVKLQVFEGPLDLLLHLIDKNKIDIYDIPIVEITNQYMDYIKAMEREDLNVMSEFLVMAATLLDIKCKMLLPKEVTEDGEEEDPRQELVEQLLQYKMYKYMSYELRDRELDGGRTLYKDPTIPEEVMNYVEPVDLDELLGNLTLATLNRVFQDVTVEEQLETVTDYAREHKHFSFRTLLGSQKSKKQTVVTFLAVLQLIKEGILIVQQEHAFDDIMITANL